ncbi:MAG: hypothetical protein RLZZ511_4358 [Cyanobacteriota bacterium]
MRAAVERIENRDDRRIGNLQIRLQSAELDGGGLQFLGMDLAPFRRTGQNLAQFLVELHCRRDPADLLLVALLLGFEVGNGGDRSG